MKSRYRITILCENTVGPVSGTLGEHGFAALVEGEKETILFDTGSGATLFANALRMNKELRRVARIVISHGHYDHTGGLLQFLQTCGGKEVLAHPEVFLARYRVKDTGERYPIGMPNHKVSLEDAGAIFSLDSRFREVANGLYLTGQVPRRTSFELGDRGMFRDREGVDPDPLTDDQSLIIRTEQGLVLLLGCCHAGLINTIDHAREQTGEERIVALVGGTHLGFAGGEQLDETVAALRSRNPGRICAGHCTGFVASMRLHREFPGRFQPANVGYSMTTA